MNTIDVMKQALEVLMVFRYAPPAQRPMVIKAIADLEQAIQKEQANIQTQITKDNLQAANVTSLQCAHCQVTIETLNDKVMRTLAEVEQLKARELGLDHKPVPVKTYSGGKAWPVQAEWVGLTDDLITEIWEMRPYFNDFARIIEAKLKEKNSNG
jgi:hypothetical protein